MDVLVINCGSSSIKADVIVAEDGARVASARVERVGTAQCFVRWDGGAEMPLGDVDHGGALSEILPTLISRSDQEVTVVGHRVVHGGETFTESALLTKEAIEAIEAVSHLAPLHNPPNLRGIRAAMEALPEATHVAVFDTSFHSGMPASAYKYGIDGELAKRYGVRRYGFHGTSHRWVSQVAADWLQTPREQLRMLTCHLGNGASVCAVERGRSVETSMGMTPLEGLVMGTRSGDIDAGAVLHLVDAANLKAADVTALLNRSSGLLGLSGLSQDLRDVEVAAANGDQRCREAIAVYAHRLKKYIGAYTAVMGGVDVVVFTGGIGQNSQVMRERALDELGFFGIQVDPDRNRDCSVSLGAPVFEISTSNSRVKVLVVATDEERAIAEDAMAIHRARGAVVAPLTVPIAISARHIHLTQQAVETLFGPGHQLTPYKPLSQPGQFACVEKLDLVGPKKTIEGVRVLGPVRPACQVEVSRSDEFTLGIDAPIRRSGHVSGSAPITLRGPAGTITLDEGLICAWRHIHMTPEDAQRFGVSNGDLVEVRVDTEGRDLTFGDVMIRVSPKYRLEMHIDTDEANAAELRSGDSGTLSATAAVAHITDAASR